MCGVAGAWQPGLTSDQWIGMLRTMARTLVHRGPDDEGIWFDAAAGLGLANRRLAVIDRSSDGHQPMETRSGRFVVSYNGEVYNSIELREELEGAGHRFRGRSDTEVLLAAVERWGVEPAMARVNGMFALALWDRERRRLHLVRDRVGEKPLYYGWAGRAFLFGSELKALAAYPGFSADVDRDAIALFLRHGFIPAPYSIYSGISKLSPGTILTLAAGHDAASARLTQTSYWSARAMAEAGTRQPFAGSPDEAADELDALLRDAVRRRMIADVPVGAFLSGGIDSSTVVALMQAEASHKVKTFTIGFREPTYDEAPHARAVAEHLGTQHVDLYVSARDAMACIPRLPALYDEPFADSSQIPTFLVCELARRHVTVSLSGDGGDELFGGYTRYRLGRRLWRMIGWMPASLRRALAAGLRATRFTDRMVRLADVMSVGDSDEMYLRLLSHWERPATLVEGAVEPPTLLTDRSSHPRLPDFTARMMYHDLTGYLPDDILVKLDRASMAVSLEARAPLLDHRVVELAWRLPGSVRIRDGVAKDPLRKVLSRYVPARLTERPKAGFGVPIDSWLRGPLRDWAASLLDERRLRREGFLKPDRIGARWREHASGRRNWAYPLWNVLMLQAWLERRSDPTRPVSAASHL